MSTRLLIPNDVQSLIEEVAPLITSNAKVKPIDVLRIALFDFKENHSKEILDENGFNQKTRNKLKQSLAESQNGQKITFNNPQEILDYVQNIAN